MFLFAYFLFHTVWNFTLHLHGKTKKLAWDKVGNFLVPSCTCPDRNIFRVIEISALTKIKLFSAALSFSLSSCTHVPISPKAVSKLTCPGCLAQHFETKFIVVQICCGLLLFLFKLFTTSHERGQVRRGRDIGSDCWWNAIRKVVSLQWSFLEGLLRTFGSITDVQITGRAV